MSSEIVSLATVGILLLLLFTGMPLAFATGMTAVVLTLWLFEPETLYFIVSRIFTLMNNYALISVPLFVLMGCIWRRRVSLNDYFMHCIFGQELARRIGRRVSSGGNDTGRHGWCHRR